MDGELIPLMQTFYTENPSVFNDRVGTLLLSLYQDVFSETTNEIILQSQAPSVSTIVQVDMDGNVVSSISGPLFAKTKKGIKILPGSVERINEANTFVADPLQKNAVIWNTENATLSNIFSEANAISGQETVNESFIEAVADESINANIQSSSLIWKYESDRYITSAKIKQQDKVITVEDGFILNETMYVSTGETITFKNNSLIPIKIYSGKTEYDDFYLNPDLSLYGSVFQSSILQPQEEWELQIDIDKSSNWFVYPTIETGKLIVQKPQVTSDDTFIISENDGKKMPFSSRIIEVDYDGNVIWSFGEAYLSNPRKVQVLSNGLLLNT